MTTKGAWVSLNPVAYEADEVHDLKGMHVHLVISPYDVPEALRLKADEVKKSLRVEFKYFGDEPTDCQNLGSSVFAELGRNSRRLYAIELENNGSRIADAMTRVEVAMRSLLGEANAHNTAKANYEVASRALHDVWAEASRQIADAQLNPEQIAAS